MPLGSKRSSAKPRVVTDDERDRPRLAVTLGDPVGIGPEVIVKAIAQGSLGADLTIYGDLGVLEDAARRCGFTSSLGSSGVTVVEVSKLAAFGAATPTPETDRAQLEYIERAVSDVLAGRMDGLVTGPISKAAIARAGSPFPGHTEMLAELSRAPGELAKRPVMMLAGPSLRVVPATVHIPLAEVPRRLSPELLLSTIRVVHASLRTDFGQTRPRMAIAGLNPHAGEGGMFGDEERRLIEPALREAQAEGLLALGPYSADTIFRRAASGEFDVVIGMYHDQCLIPVKLLDFDRAVNVTLGLSISRTSVDHGTAYDIAGLGVASATSMRAAIDLAISMAQARRSAAP